MICRNHSNMLIYDQCWKHLCCLIVFFFFFFFNSFGTCDNFLGFVDKSNLKRTGFIQNIDVF